MFWVTFQILSFSLIAVCFCYKDSNWWDSAVFYNVFPRSFKDSNNDGSGDLRGVTEKMQYIKDLGVDALYLNSFYQSPMADTGYDISDFVKVDPLFGTMEDLDELIAKCKKLGLKFIIDFVPNHTSDQHEWFQKSIDGIQPYADYYVWRNASGFKADGTPIPPNHWRCVFGGTSWEWNKKRNQFYYHIFYKNQPDLDYRNERVVEESKNILRFWLQKGIDGIRIDAIRGLLENFTCDIGEEWSLKCQADLLETYSYVGMWRDLLHEFSAKTDNQKKMILIEFVTYFQDETYERERRYLENGADVVYHYILYGLPKIELNATSFSNRIRGYMNTWLSRNYSMNWILAVHDYSRPATLLGDEMADSYAMIVLTLPGNVFIYNGVELGMRDFEQMKPKIDGRDRFRTPFQWDDSPQAGFSKNKTTWLPVNPDYYKRNVKMESKDPNSHLNFFKKLIQMRKLPQFKTGSVEVHRVSDTILAFSRFSADIPNEKFFVLTNTGSELECVPLKEDIPGIPDTIYVHMKTLSSEHDEGDKFDTTNCFSMRPKSSAILSTNVPTSSGASVTTAAASYLILAVFLVMKLGHIFF